MFKNWKMILALAIPSIASFAMATITGTINLIMVGHLGAVAIAVVGVSNIIMYNSWALFSGIGHTINYMVAQNYGAKDMKKGIERTTIALYLCIAVSILIMVVGAFFSDTILRIIAGSDKIASEGDTYLQIRFFAMVFGIFNFVFHGFFRGIGDTRTPMVLSLLGSILMVFFTYVFTNGALGFPNIGMDGAGWAVFIGEAVGFLGCLYVYFIRLHDRYQTRTKVNFNRSEFNLIFKESGKLGVQEFAMSVSMFIFTMFVARLGENALAANEIALSVMSLGFMPAFAFGATATILVGQEVGKGSPLQARRIGTDTAIMGSIFLLVLGTIEFFLAMPIAKIYTSDPKVYELVAFLISISAFFQVFDGLFNFYAGGLRGLGETTFLFRASFVLNFLLFLPLSYLLIFVADMGSIGAWLSLYIFLLALGISVMVRFYRTDWANVRMKVADEKTLAG